MPLAHHLEELLGLNPPRSTQALVHVPGHASTHRPLVGEPTAPRDGLADLQFDLAAGPSYSLDRSDDQPPHQQSLVGRKRIRTSIVFFVLSWS